MPAPGKTCKLMPQSLTFKCIVLHKQEFALDQSDVQIHSFAPITLTIHVTISRRKQNMHQSSRDEHQGNHQGKVRCHFHMNAKSNHRLLNTTG